MSPAVATTIALTITVLLSGCGESASERTENRTRDETTATIEQRVQALEGRISVLEKDHVK